MAGFQKIAVNPDGRVRVQTAPKFELEFGSLELLRMWLDAPSEDFDEASLKQLLAEHVASAKTPDAIATAKPVSVDLKSAVADAIAAAVDVQVEAEVKHG